MRIDVTRLSDTPTNEDVQVALASGQDLFPVVDASGAVVSVISRDRLGSFALGTGGPRIFIGDRPEYVHPDETLRYVAHKMARGGRTRLLVANGGQGDGIVGVISLPDLLKAYEKNLGAEETREHYFSLGWRFKAESTLPLR